MMKKKFFNQSFSRFSIRKLSVGTCSVLLGTFMVMATSPVQADEAQVNNKEQQTQAEIQQKEKSAENGQEVISEPQKEVTQNEAVKDQLSRKARKKAVLAEKLLLGARDR